MSDLNKKKAIIIGAGPAGLTAAYELLEKTDIQPIVFEQDAQVGGLSRTVNYKENRIDIGGHRFFSKFDQVTNWWQKFLPLQEKLDPSKFDNVMLVRNRLSRIFFLRKFFNYPISLNIKTLSNLGLKRVFKIGTSYVKVRAFPIKKEKSLEDFFINRFGKELYKTFFKDYTHKVWGVECNQISASWGAQRIKGLSISKAIIHALKSAFPKKKDIKQKNTETTLIGSFMYPKFGPGQLWEEVAKNIEKKGGEINLQHEIVGFKTQDNKITAIKVEDKKTGTISEITGDYFFSTMPVKDLIKGMGEVVRSDVKKISQGLIYRDFITVGLLLKKMNFKVKDNWIYIQERDVKVGRIQVFNNWSPYMVKDQDKTWIGLEYFCNQGDELWNKSDKDFINFAIDELCKIGFIGKEDVVDSVVIRMPKTYPAYFGSYDKFDEVRNFVDKYENLFLIGRNGMHRYNNMDHSMLTAMAAVDNIINDVKTKDNIWNINAEQEYHEEKTK